MFPFPFKFLTKPLHLAVIDDDIETVRQLLESERCDVNERDGKEGSTPLLLAAICHRLEIAELLITNNADMSMENFMGIDVVYTALTMNHDTLLLMLMNHGVFINPTTNYDWVSLVESAPRGLNISISAPCIRLLLAYTKTKTFCFDGVLAFAMSKRYNDIVGVLQEEIRRRKASPPSLHDLCKVTVRSCLGSMGLHRKIDRLPLPRLLKKNLKHV